MYPRRKRVGTVALFIVVALSVVSMGGAEVAVAQTNYNVDATQDGTQLEITVSGDAFDDPENATIDIWFDETRIYTEVNSSQKSPDAISFEVDLKDQSFTDGSNVDVTVTQSGENETEIGTVNGLDLRYIAFDGSTARFDDKNQLAVPVTEAIGISNKSEPYIFTAEETDKTLDGTYSDTDEGGKVVFERSDAFAALVQSGDTWELAAADDGPTVAESTVIRVDDITQPPETLINGSELLISHPLIVSGTDYVVTVEGRVGEETPKTTVRVSGSDNTLLAELPENVASHPSVVKRVTVADEQRELGSDTLEEKDTSRTATIEDKSKITVERLDDVTSKDENVDVYLSFDDPSRDHRFVQDVSTEGNMLVFQERKYEITGSERDLLILTDSEVVTATVGEDNELAVGSETTDEVGLFSGPSMPFSQMEQVPGFIILLIILGMILMIGVVVVFKSHSSSSDMGPQSRDVDVQLIDKQTGGQIDETRSVVFDPIEGSEHSSNQEYQISGSGQVQIKNKQYIVSVKGTNVKTQIGNSRDSVELPIPPQRREIHVYRKGDNSLSVSDAEIQCHTPDSSSSGFNTRTGLDGRATIKLPPSVDPKDCTIEINHERYQPRETELQSSIGVEPRTGRVTVKTEIDGEPIGNVDISLQPANESAQINNSETSKEKRTDETGRVDIDVIIGEYTVSALFASDIIIGSEDHTIDVKPGRQQTVTIDGTFNFDLKPYRNQINELHREVSNLTPSNRDGAIPYYYASVLSKALNLLEEFLDNGVLFYEHGVDPDELTSAVIKAVEDAIEYTHDAMTTKQNVDLFSACSALRDERVRWEGNATTLGNANDQSGRQVKNRPRMLNELVSVVASNRANHRGLTADRLEETDDLLSRRREKVSTILPVREQYNQIREHLSSNPGTSRVEKRTQFVLAIWMLDAVQRVFDHPELVSRLEETVF